jgi:hypothetical protein
MQGTGRTCPTSFSTTGQRKNRPGGHIQNLIYNRSEDEEAGEDMSNILVYTGSSEASLLL